MNKKIIYKHQVTNYHLRQDGSFLRKEAEELSGEIILLVCNLLGTEESDFFETISNSNFTLIHDIENSFDGIIVKYVNLQS